MSDASTTFALERARFRDRVVASLQAEEPIVPGNVELIEAALAEAEVEAAHRALLVLGPPPASGSQEPFFVKQTGTTCMSVSLANGIIALGEPCLVEDPERRVTLLAEDIVLNTSALGKPGEYRSVDDLFKYLESGRLRELDLDGKRFQSDYRVRLTNSLLDSCEALWTGRGRLVVQRRAHARLAFALDFREDGTPLVRVRDPMLPSGPDYEVVDLATLRADFLWSPLKKVPRILGPGLFESLTAREVLSHLERYDSMENLGVDCPSALVYRAADAPPLFSPPPKPENAEEPKAAE
ncbi:hypothetical protein HY251_05180 [bacterium]|nr:hypothetical protein [bacterium]